MILLSLLLSCSQKSLITDLSKDLAQPYQKNLNPFDSLYCDIYRAEADKQFRKNPYKAPIAEELERTYTADQSAEDFVLQNIYGSQAKQRVLSYQVRQISQYIGLSCPPIAKQIPMFERDWKNPQAETFLANNLPSFADTPIKIVQKDGVWTVLDKRSNAPFDIVIVGSGISGAMMAHQLQQKGKSVLVLEGGHFSVPGVFDTRQMSDLRMQYGSFRDKKGLIAFEMASAVGGGGTINADLAFSPVSDLVSTKMELWRTEERIEAEQWRLDDRKDAYDKVLSLIGTRELDEKEINANNKILWDGAKKIGLQPDLYALNRSTWEKSTSPLLTKKSPIESLLYPGLSDPQNTLGLLPRAHVLKAHRSKDNRNRISHLEVQFKAPKTDTGYLDAFHGLDYPLDTTVHVPASSVVLSAGTVGSTVILQNSDIDNPNLGRGIIGHISFPVLGSFDRKIEANRGVTASVFLDDMAAEHGFILESMTAGKLYIAALFAGRSEEIAPYVLQTDQLGGFGVMLVDSVSQDNRIIANKEGYEIDYTLSASDQKRLQIGIDTSVEILFAAGAKEVIIPSFEKIRDPQDGMNVFSSLSEYKQAKKLEFIAGQTSLISAHLMGSNKMGTQPQNSVVDPNHKVWGMDNLYVVDGSILPTSPGANPMQTLYTLSYMAAQELDL